MTNYFKASTMVVIVAGLAVASCQTTNTESLPLAINYCVKSCVGVTSTDSACPTPNVCRSAETSSDAFGQVKAVIAGMQSSNPQCNYVWDLADVNYQDLQNADCQTVFD